MILPKNIKCLVCSKIFCCAKCRIKHEEKVHVVLNKENCFICDHQPFILQAQLNSKILIEHICQVHLPLQCKKCFKMFSQATDFTDFNKCTKPSTTAVIVKSSCCLEKIVESKEKQFETNSEAIQEGQIVENIDAKQENEDINILPDTNNFDNSAIQNCIKDILTPPSSNNNSVESLSIDSTNLTKIGNTKKETRSTSTPMHQFAFTKNIKSNTFNMSSINSNGSDSDISPPTSSFASVDSAKKILSNNSSNVRLRYPTAPTPLRQVMSKSIQRAIAQHGNEFNFKPKKIFNSSNESSNNNSTTISSPLDLRTTPVLRRTKSEFSDYRKIEMKLTIPALSLNNFKKLDNEKKKIDASKDINSNKELIPCKNIINNKLKLKSIDEFPNHETPKIFGSTAIKKAISFSSPPIETPNIQEITNDIWYTPGDIPTKSSSFSSLKIKEDSIESIDFIDTDVKNDEKNVMKENPSGGGRLWSILTSVMRLASFGSTAEKIDDKPQPKKILNQSTLVQKSSSATELTYYESSSGSNSDDDQPRKRRKFVTNIVANHRSENSFRRKRIKGRLPIRSMRNNPPS